MTTEDLASHSAEWVDPISSHYRALTLHELPPNGQGIATLMACEILNHFDLSAMQAESAEAVHLQVEAMKLALADAYRYVTDPVAMQLSVPDLCDPAYLRKRAGLIDRRQANLFTHGLPGQSETVYLTAADASGMMVSFIQSNYMGFGSGVVVPETGISLQNRGASFRLQPDHPNCVAGGKRPFHTIIPGIMEKDGVHIGFGIMGGLNQAQAHAQFVSNIPAPAMMPRGGSGTSLAGNEGVPTAGPEFLEQVAEFIGGINDLFGGFKERATQVSEALRSPEVAFVLVTSPDPMAISEAGYFSDKLDEAEMNRKAIIVNQVHPLLPEPGIPEAEQVEQLAQQLPSSADARDLRPRLQRALDDERAWAVADRRQIDLLTAQVGAETPIIEVPAFDEDVHDIAALAKVAFHLTAAA